MRQYTYTLARIQSVSGGYTAVAAYAVAIAVIFLLAGWILLAVGNRLGTRKGSTAAAREVTRG
jgi:hypothetical protein